MSRKYWVQFLTKDLTGQVADALGSDGVYRLDGRLSQYNMELAGMRRADVLSLVKKFVGFQIVVGGLRFTQEHKRSRVIPLKYPLGPV